MRLSLWFSRSWDEVTIASGVRPQVHDAVLAPGDEAVAIPLELVNPLRPDWDLVNQDRLARSDKTLPGAFPRFTLHSPSRSAAGTFGTLSSSGEPRNCGPGRTAKDPKPGQSRKKEASPQQIWQ